jgi:hypothetical protein
MAEEKKTKVAVALAWFFGLFSFLAFGVIIAVLLLFALRGTILKAEGKEVDKFAVTGTGVVRVPPDHGVISVGVVVEAGTVEEAQNENNTRIEAVKNALKALGIEDKDITTSSFQIFPKVTDTPCVIPLKSETSSEGSTDNLIAPAPTPSCITGSSIQRVEHFLEVRVRKIDSVGKAIDTATAAGATNIDTVRFVLEDQHEKNVEKEARAKAVGDAEARAKQLAESSKTHRGKLHLLSEQSYVGPIFYAAEAVSKGTTIQPGDLDVTVTVQAEYLID